MSHELRTPLNAILGFSEVMKSELFGKHQVPAYREYSNDIHASGKLLLDIINDAGFGEGGQNIHYLEKKLGLKH